MGVKIGKIAKSAQLENKESGDRRRRFFTTKISNKSQDGELIFRRGFRGLRLCSTRPEQLSKGGGTRILGERREKREARSEKRGERREKREARSEKRGERSEKREERREERGERSEKREARREERGERSEKREERKGKGRLRRGRDIFCHEFHELARIHKRGQ